jgi:hypothetical protein
MSTPSSRRNGSEVDEGVTADVHPEAVERQADRRLAGRLVMDDEVPAASDRRPELAAGEHPRRVRAVGGVEAVA